MEQFPSGLPALRSGQSVVLPLQLRRDIDGFRDLPLRERPMWDPRFESVQLVQISLMTMVYAIYRL